MLDHFLRDRAAAERLRANPIGSHLDGFTAWLSQRGYAWTTIRQHVWAVAAFGRWLDRRGRSVKSLRQRDADGFCRRRCAVHRRERDIAALRWFLNYLEAEHFIPATPRAIDRSPLARIKDRYEAYLQRDRALSPLTATRHWFALRRFLVERFGDGRIDLRVLRADDVTRYLLRHVPAQSRFSTHGSMLRSFLRFLWQAGDIDRDLAAAIPPIRRWRLVEAPKYLLAAEVARLLASVDRKSASGRRNYAILLLLARLGLRAGEVVRLELEDLDWRTGELTVRGKGSVHARLPLPRDVGAALVTYLRKDRPPCATRRVFVCLKAPHRGLGHPATVSTLVHCALNRVGLTPPTTGAHLLRHSLATNLLRHGSSLGDIGEVLRHRLPQTTEIYAKVDVDRLRTLAPPWPMPRCPMTALRRAIDDYLALRRRLGSALHEVTRVLHLFARFAEQEGACRVTTDLAQRWATHFPNLSPVSVQTRFQIVRRFAEWRHVTDPLTEIPPIDLLPARYYRKPLWLYQDADIDRLLEAARHLPSPGGLPWLTFSTLLGLLVVTGLRISEALALDDADVQRQDAQLMIRRSKFGKSRLVPLHVSTLAALTAYAHRRDRVLPRRTTPAFFVSEHGVRLTVCVADYTFARISGQIGLRAPVHGHRLGHGPRLHDLRHRFAIRTLVAWYRAGLDVDPLLPLLATYLGHVHVHETYWYLEAVPELLALATERLVDGRKAVAP